MHAVAALGGSRGFIDPQSFEKGVLSPTNICGTVLNVARPSSLRALLFQFFKKRTSNARFARIITLWVNVARASLFEIVFFKKKAIECSIKYRANVARPSGPRFLRSSPLAGTWE